MGAVDKPILLDADAVISLLEWRVYDRVRKALGERFCVAEYVVRQEVKFHKDRATGRRVRFDGTRITPTSVPRLICVEQLSSQQNEDYLRHFASLRGADPGERETFALAWVLDYDVCSWDAAARDIFHEHRPDGCSSRYVLVLDLLRRLRLIP